MCKSLSINVNKSSDISNNRVINQEIPSGVDLSSTEEEDNTIFEQCDDHADKENEARHSNVQSKKGATRKGNTKGKKQDKNKIKSEAISRIGSSITEDSLKFASLKTLMTEQQSSRLSKRKEACEEGNEGSSSGTRMKTDFKKYKKLKALQGKR